MGQARLPVTSLSLSLPLPASLPPSLISILHSAMPFHPSIHPAILDLSTTYIPSPSLHPCFLPPIHLPTQLSPYPSENLLDNLSSDIFFIHILIPSFPSSLPGPPSILISIQPSPCMTLHLSTDSPSVCPSVHPPIHPSVRLSIHPYCYTSNSPSSTEQTCVWH